MSFTTEQVNARTKVWEAARDGAEVELDASEVRELWDSVLADGVRIAELQSAEATVSKLHRIARDAAAKMLDPSAKSHERTYWHGMKDGLLRAVTTVEGRDHSPS